MMSIDLLLRVPDEGQSLMRGVKRSQSVHLLEVLHASQQAKVDDGVVVAKYWRQTNCDSWLARL
jgi:hypothetical protein